MLTESPTPGGERSKESGTQELHNADADESELEDDPNDQLENEGYKTPGRSNASHLTVGAEANAFIQAEC